VTRNFPDRTPTQTGAGGEGKPPPPAHIPDHELVRCIGSGSYGDVWLARNIMGTYRAVKVVYRQTFQDDRPYEREFNGIMKFEPVSRSHENLIDILQIGRNDEARFYYYVMELGDDALGGGNVNPERYVPKTLGTELSARGKLPAAECVQVAIPLAAAVQHLHKHGLIHRDIKPSNIIFVNGIPKLADIGLVTDLGAAKSYVGTEGFMPPEGPGTAQADIFSLGKVFYEMSTGHDRQAFPELPTRVQEWEDFSTLGEFNEIVLKACESDPQRRYESVEELTSDLLLLQSGKSVKRLRVLEHRMALLGKAAFLTVVVALVAAGISYQLYLQLRRKAEARQRQVGSIVAYGTRTMEEGDLFGSLPWFVEALRLEENDPVLAESHRTRIATILNECPKLLRMWPHPALVNHAEFSPDGKYVVTASKNGQVTVWKTDSDLPVQHLLGHMGEVEMACFSPGGEFVISAGVGDRTARVWSRATGKEIFPGLRHDASVYCARFSPDGRLIATASGDDNSGAVKIWDAKAGILLRTVDHKAANEPGRSAFRHVEFSRDGRRLAVAAEDGTAQVWEVGSWTRAFNKPIQSKSWIFSVAFSPDSRYLATAEDSRRVQICDALTGAPVFSSLKHSASVLNVEFSPDGRLLLTSDFTARMWDFANGDALTPPFKTYRGNIIHGSFNPSGTQVVVASEDHICRLWDITPNSGSLPAGPSFYSLDGSRYATVEDGVVQLRDAKTKAAITRAMEVDGRVTNLFLNADAGRVLVVFSNPALQKTSRLGVQLFDGSNRVSFPAITVTNSVAGLSADGTRMVTLGGNVAEAWDTASGTRIAGPLRHPGAVASKVAFDPRGERLATASDATAFVWDIRTGTLLHELPHEAPVSHIEFSPDGLLLVTACKDSGYEARYAQVWDALTGKPLTRLQHGDGVYSASFHPNGKWVVTASEDKTAQIWEIATGKSLRVLKHPHEVFQAVFNQKGRWLVTTCRDGSVRVWNTETGEPLTPSMRHVWGPNVLVRAQFIADSQSILVQRKTGESCLIPLPQDNRSVDDLRLLSEVLYGMKIEGGPSGPTVALKKQVLLEIWDRLRKLYPEEFTVSPQQEIYWHERQAEASEKAKQWFAAFFHWQKLAQLAPDNLEYQNRSAQLLVPFVTPRFF